MTGCLWLVTIWAVVGYERRVALEMRRDSQKSGVSFSQFSEFCAAPASMPAAPGCGCVPCTSWATTPPASAAPSASARRPSAPPSAATPPPSAPASATPSPACTAPGGTSAPPSAPAPSAPPPAAKRSPATGAPCAGLDDDQFDTPGYRPASGWKPAAGTGTAPDIHPPARVPKKRRPRDATTRDTRCDRAGAPPWH